MRFSRTLIPTLKENPGEARVVSHQLMMRAGLIRQLTAGIYTWLPLGLKALRKVENIVRAEMDAAGAQEVLMPAVQPAELWQESGRWSHYGKELLRIRDRHDREFCFGPTHEEVITDLVRREVQSYRALPANFYQIQTKFRDEIRPRFGIMRGREFLMKDAYSFDMDADGLDESYRLMFAAYERIFRRCGLRFRPVEADTGAIGGASSHEFHVLAESGEDAILSCSACGYAANLEKAVSGALAAPGAGEDLSGMSEVETPGKETIADVAAFLNTEPSRTVKTLAVVSGEVQWTLLLLRGDHELNEVKAGHLLGEGFRIPAPEETRERTGLPVGSLGPVDAPGGMAILADEALRGAANMITGANRAGFHLTGVNWTRDLPEPAFADLRNAEHDDPCSRCEPGRLSLDRGIEVGHVFKLGEKYSRSLNLRVLDEQGKERHPLMGCYGIGVSRIVAAAIEQNHDENGIVWPVSLAPFQVEVLLVNPKDAHASGVAEKLYQELMEAGVEVLLDDRDERLGVKFKDADLLGAPFRVLVGGRSLKEGVLELQARLGGERENIPPEQAVEMLMGKLGQMRREQSAF